MVQIPRLPASWSDAEILDGLDITPKDDLLGRAFRITHVQFRINDRNVSIVDVDAEFADGSTFTFNDSSSGVRAQLVKYLTVQGRDSGIDSGESIPVSLVIPNGLRKSEYMATDENNKPVKATTYYLTTSGKRGVTATPAKTATPRVARTRSE